MGELLDTLVLAFDLGTHEAGWVLVDTNMKILHLGYWKAIKGDLDMRLQDLMLSLESNLLQIGQANVAGLFTRILVAYEAPYVRYAAASLPLAQAVGILKTLLWQIPQVTEEFLPMAMEITPAEAKLAITGRGNAGKLMVLDMARQLSGCMELNQHQADAYGVACAAWGQLHQEAMLEMAKEESDE